MKKIILFSIFSLLTMFVFGQKKISKINKNNKIEIKLEPQQDIIDKDEVLPPPQLDNQDTNKSIVAAEFIGGKKAMLSFITDNLKYPKELYSKKIEQTIRVSFRVEDDGSISDISSVNNQNDKFLAAEAVRVVSIMPKWTPLFYFGKYVKSSGFVNIVFKIKK